MKLETSLSVVLVFVAAGCASAAKAPAQSTSTTSASVAAQPEAEKTAAERWAESKTDKEAAKAKAAPREAFDPLSVNSALEEASVPKIDYAPKGELRPKGRGDLDAAMGLVKSASSVDQATKRLTGRLGKPTWIEDGKKRVWVAMDGARCHRLVLDADGTVDVETASKTDWSMLSALAQQNPCTGEIKRGVPGGK